MRRSFSTLSGVLIVSLFSNFGWADSFKNNFTANVNTASLDALAKDLGSLMGSGSFHQGKALGVPGFDVGVQISQIGVANADVILRDDGSSAQAEWAQVEVGLPLKIDVIGRVGQMEDGKMLGGGLRYGLYKTDLPGLPSIALSALYGKMDHDLFDLDTFTANLVASFNVPLVHPYLGVGYDNSELKPTSQGFIGVPATVSRSTKGKADGYRAEVGINLSIIPFTYINLGGGLANGDKLFHGGLGVRF